MVRIDETLVSDDVLKEHFVCNLEACKGACCIEGDLGAPLEKEELPAIRKNLPAFLERLPVDQQESIREKGFYEVAPDGELVTQCMPDGRCVFVTEHEGILGCAMEEAHREGQSDFLKPVSCHLYPVRVKRYKEFTAVNYDEWSICSPACIHGAKLGVRVFEFVENALVRKFGEEWMETLKATAKHLEEEEAKNAGH